MGQVVPFTSGQPDTSEAAGTRYLRHYSGGSSPTTEADALRWRVPAAGSIAMLYTETKQGATGATTLTVRKNGVDTTLTTGSLTGTGAVVATTDSTHTVSVAAGDIITVSAVITTVAVSVKACQIEYTRS